MKWVLTGRYSWIPHQCCQSDMKLMSHSGWFVSLFLACGYHCSQPHTSVSSGNHYLFSPSDEKQQTKKTVVVNMKYKISCFEISLIQIHTGYKTDFKAFSYEFCKFSTPSRRHFSKAFSASSMGSVTFTSSSLIFPSRILHTSVFWTSWNQTQDSHYL